MSADESSYAPKSPDLSSFPLDDESPQLPQRLPTQQSYPRPGQPQQPRTYYQQPVQQPYQFAFSQPTSQPQQQPHTPTSIASHSSPYKPEPLPPSLQFRQYPPQQIQPQSQLVQQAQVGYGVQSPTTYQENYYPPYGGGPQQGYQTQGYQVPQQLFYNKPVPSGQRNSLQETRSQAQGREQADSQIPSHQEFTQPQPQPQSDTMPPRRSAAASGSQQAAITPSPVKTKFPTARIKRIMQADEEVGKVAQQTPIAVGKALEMFMIALVTKSAEVAKEKNSKRVTAQMLKQVVESDEQWDFLRDIVGKVDGEEKKPGKSKTAKNESDDTESEEEVVEKKKRVGRKKKV